MLIFNVIGGYKKRNTTKSDASSVASKSTVSWKPKSTKVSRKNKENQEKPMQSIEEEEPECTSPLPQSSNAKRPSPRTSHHNQPTADPVSDVEEPEPVSNTRKASSSKGAQFKIPNSLNIPKQKRARGVETVQEEVPQGDNVSHDSGLQSVSEASVSIEPFRKRLRVRK